MRCSMLSICSRRSRSSVWRQTRLVCIAGRSGNSDYTIFYRISWKKEIIEVVRIMDARRVRDLKRVPR